MSRAILFRSSGDAQRWKKELGRHLPDLDFRVHPQIGDPAEVEIAVMWRPPQGLLASLPNLKLIVSLGAGVDHLLDDPALPRRVPIMRLVDPHMVAAMSEYVLTQVLRLHRQDPTYLAQQRALVWRGQRQRNASECRVGILGLGQFGADPARKLAPLALHVARRRRGAEAIPPHASCYRADG